MAEKIVVALGGNALQSGKGGEGRKKRHFFRGRLHYAFHRFPLGLPVRTQPEAQRENGRRQRAVRRAPKIGFFRDIGKTGAKSACAASTANGAASAGQARKRPAESARRAPRYCLYKTL